MHSYFCRITFFTYFLLILLSQHKVAIEALKVHRTLNSQSFFVKRPLYSYKASVPENNIYLSCLQLLKPGDGQMHGNRIEFHKNGIKRKFSDPQVNPND